jgi:hypothetical protein
VRINPFAERTSEPPASPLLQVHKISEEHGGKVLAAGGLAAVLAYLDFFPISVQRTGVQTVLNMCQHAHPEQMGLVEASLEQMSNLLQSQDAKLVGTSLSAFCKLVSNMQGHPAHLETIASRGLVDSTWRIVAASFSSSSSSSSSSGNRPSTGGEQTTIRCAPFSFLSFLFFPFLFFFLG